MLHAYCSGGRHRRGLRRKRMPQAADWAVNIYDLSGNLLDNSGSIDASEASANIGDLWDPPPFQVSLQAQDSDGVNFDPESNKVSWAG
jgi:hypothetical protein